MLSKKKEMEARPQKNPSFSYNRLTNLNKTASDKGARRARVDGFDGRCKALKMYRVFGTMFFFFFSITEILLNRHQGDATMYKRK